ncbi:hypothetical protein ACFWYW_28455 [Nonomuraea sp. NPDC059023]|uniref:hypothetical protein n=1 Tax=unclassified Nonomuraea TaxID=2593643 RepID=UPI00368A0F23
MSVELDSPLVFDAALRKIEEYWAVPMILRNRFERDLFPIVGTEHDQLVPSGIDNPYWELIRRLPSRNDGTWQGVTPYGYIRDLDIGRTALVTTYAWSIPSPGDISWIASLLDGRAVVEVGAGSGYWAWQLAQAGVDVAPYEPEDLADNTFVGAAEPYVTLLKDDASAAREHPDRALFMSWPSYGGSWAAHALSVYQGDLFIYAGESEGGCCADDPFFHLLGAEWTEVGDSLHHRTWWGINCRLMAFRRKSQAEATS